jgi:hypothetical protein
VPNWPKQVPIWPGAEMTILGAEGTWIRVMVSVLASSASDRCKNIFDIYVTEYGTALTTILPILFLYLNAVIVTAGTFEP